MTNCTLEAHKKEREQKFLSYIIYVIVVVTWQCPVFTRANHQIANCPVKSYKINVKKKQASNSVSEWIFAIKKN